MPFQSEKQRRYLWANEPEIARDWADTYGSRVEKSNGGIMNWAGQGGMKNYLGEQPMVSAPKYWQSAPDHEMTELAYITPKEKDVLVDMDMYGSMQGQPNEGPSGIMSLNGWGSSDSSQNRAGADISAAMDRSGSDRGWSRPGGFTSPAAKSPAELKAIADRKFSNTVMPSSFYGKQYKAPKGSNSFMGGIGKLLSFINPLNLLGGFIDNPIMRGIFSGVVNNAGKFKKGMNEFSQYDNLADYLKRNKNTGIETVDIRDKFNRKNNKETMTADLNLDFITPKTISSELDYNTPITERWANQTGYNLNEAGLNKAQTDYLDKIGKTNKDVGNTGYFTYNTPEQMKGKIQGLNKESEGFFGGFDSDKITFGDKNTYATDKDVNKYMMENYNLEPKNEGIKNVLGLDI